jgi:hypothetical protein
MKTAAVEIYCCKKIAAFQLAGYSAWTGEAAGSNPACYTKGGHVPRLANNICNVIVQGSIPWLSTERPVSLTVQDSTLSMC